MTRNEGSNIVFGVAAATTFLAAGSFSAHQRGMEAVRAACETEDEARYEAAVDQLLRDNAELGQIAIRLSKELATERAKNASLQRALEQRQAVLDRIRNDRT